MAKEDSSQEISGSEKEEMGTQDSDEAGEIKAQLKEAESLADERLDQLKRCRAELDNALKIAAREREEHIRHASERIVSKLLCVLDSLEQASKHDEGAKILYQQLFDVLKGEGLVPIESKGLKFDPYRHEALMQMNVAGLEDGVVCEEIQKGYLLGSRVIRFSKVAVAKSDKC
jgi:molecular chaperone GrpE